jgi:hypothetical protein
MKRGVRWSWLQCWRGKADTALTDEEAIYDRVRWEGFESQATLPFGWVATAFDLKDAADRLYDLNHAASLRSIDLAHQLAAQGAVQSGSQRPTHEEWESIRDIKLIRPYMLLIGYATENLLKAILVVQKPSTSEKTAGKLKVIKTHDLGRLCDMCAIALCQEERDMLDRMTRYVEWLGRYPVPLKAEDMLPAKPCKDYRDFGAEMFRGREQQVELGRLWVRIGRRLDEVHEEVSERKRPSS